MSTLSVAKCNEGGFTIWPENNKLCVGGIIMLEAYGNSESIVRNLNTKYSIYLKSDNDKIKLIIIDQQSGDINTSQVILKPESDLIVGKKYNLIIDSLDTEQLDNLNKCHAKYTISKNASPSNVRLKKYQLY